MLPSSKVAQLSPRCSAVYFSHLNKQQYTQNLSAHDVGAISLETILNALQYLMFPLHNLFCRYLLVSNILRSHLGRHRLDLFIFARHEDAGHSDHMQLSRLKYLWSPQQVCIHEVDCQEKCLISVLVSLTNLQQPIYHLSPHVVADPMPADHLALIFVLPCVIVPRAHHHIVSARGQAGRLSDMGPGALDGGLAQWIEPCPIVVDRVYVQECLFMFFAVQLQVLGAQRCILNCGQIVGAQVIFLIAEGQPPPRFMRLPHNEQQLNNIIRQIRRAAIYFDLSAYVYYNSQKPPFCQLLTICMATSDIASLDKAGTASANAPIWKHFKRNFETNEFICLYCGKRGIIKTAATEILYKHLFKRHPGAIHPRESPLPNQIKPLCMAKNIMEENEAAVSDQWLDRLAIDGYNVRDILTSIYVRFKEDSITFGKYMSRRAASLVNCKYKVKNFMPKIPLLMHPNEVCPLLMDKYRISEEGAKLLLRDYMWIYQNETEVLSQLERRGLTVLKMEEDRCNKVIFMCNEHMRANYGRFGDAVTVQFRSLTIRNSGEKKKVFVGVFAGQDTGMKHTILGFAVLSEESPSYYFHAFKYFLKAMRARTVPKCFIVGLSPHLLEALNHLNQYCYMQRGPTIGFMVNWHHLIQQFVQESYKWEGAVDRSSITSKFNSLLSSLNPEQIDDRVEDMKCLYGDGEKGHELVDFMRQHRKYLMGENKARFVGFGIEKDHWSILNKIVLSFMGQSENIGFLFFHALKLQEMLLGRLCKGLDLFALHQFRALGIQPTDQLKFLSKRLQKPLFKKFLLMYRTAVKNAYVVACSQNGLQYKIAYRMKNKPCPQSKAYILRYSVQHQHWSCSCNFIYWSGIPCAHLIRIIRKFRGSMTYYINSRWLIDSNSLSHSTIFSQQQANMRPECQDPEQPQQEYMSNNVQERPLDTDNT